MYLAAFLSAAVQIDGLLGPDGIYPVERILVLAKDRLGGEAYLALPSLTWIVGASSAALKAMAVSGALASLALFAGWFSPVALVVCWVAYLSIVAVGGIFFQYQWDSLLLETGFLAIFLPSGWRPRTAPPPPTLVWWTFRLLLFRLMFESAVCKVASGDPTWRSLSALSFHYETQPLPNALSFFLHHFPLAWHRLSTVGMFLVEAVAPFAIFARAPLRKLGAITLAGLQLAIAASGNYGFFNLLSVLLCLFLCEDSFFPSRPVLALGATPRRLRSAVPAGIFLLAFLEFGATFFPSLRDLPFGVAETVGALRIVGSYGLFAVMTTRRDEIRVEGSQDGKEWKAYRFAWKPEAPEERPKSAFLHMPRLDWQMWFLALDNYDRSPWFASFEAGLLANRPAVVRLLETNPFPEAPPRYLRSLRQTAHFASWEELRKLGLWWAYGAPEPFGPVVSR